MTAWKRCFTACKALPAIAKHHTMHPVIVIWMLGNMLIFMTGYQHPVIFSNSFPRKSISGEIGEASREGLQAAAACQDNFLSLGVG